MIKVSEKLESLFMTAGKHIDFATVITLIALIFATVGIDPITLQSWNDLGTALYLVISNPYKVGLIAVSLYGWYRNNQLEFSEKPSKWVR